MLKEEFPRHIRVIPRDTLDFTVQRFVKFPLLILVLSPLKISSDGSGRVQKDSELKELMVDADSMRETKALYGRRSQRKESFRLHRPVADQGAVQGIAGFSNIVLLSYLPSTRNLHNFFFSIYISFFFPIYILFFYMYTVTHLRFGFI